MQCCSTDTGNVSVVFPVTLQVEASSGQARAGIAVTARGSYETPTFMPVGTRGAVKYLDAHDYRDIGAQIVLGNTYHLMLRPGADVVEQFGAECDVLTIEIEHVSIEGIDRVRARGIQVHPAPEVLRTIHSFDPCLACAIHTVDAEGKEIARVKAL